MEREKGKVMVKNSVQQIFAFIDLKILNATLLK
jgi:hypothetical protein